MPNNALAIGVTSISLITAAVSLAIMIVKLRIARISERQLKNELTLQSTALDFGGFLREWGDTHFELEALLNDTCIDRFIILRAWNGRLSPRWTTAVFQLRESDQENFSYVHFELDADYVERLRQVVDKGSILFNVKDIPKCAIRSVYENEGVTSTFWAHLGSHATVNKDSRVITYCSFSTHNAEGLSPNDIIRARMIVGRLKGVANQFEGLE